VLVLRANNHVAALNVHRGAIVMVSSPSTVNASPLQGLIRLSTNGTVIVWIVVVA
jgi:hypothetical protein